MPARVLVIEDDALIADTLRLALEQEGYHVTLAWDGQSGLSAFRGSPADIVLLDVMLPNLNGLAVCSQIRQLDQQVPIILLTGLGEERQKAEGLDQGADDYVTKPFSLVELLARLRAQLRRTRELKRAPTSLLLSFPGLEIEPTTRRVVVDGRPVELTPKEFELLYLLAREPGRTFTRDELLEQVWHYPAGTDARTLNSHVLRLRRKLEGAKHSYLQTVWGVGFKFLVLPA